MANGDRSSLLALFGVGLAAVIYSADNPAKPWHIWDSMVGLTLLFMVLSVRVPSAFVPLLAYSAILSISVITAIGVLLDLMTEDNAWLECVLADHCPEGASPLDCAPIRRLDLFYFLLWVTITAFTALAARCCQNRNRPSDDGPAAGRLGTQE